VEATSLFDIGIHIKAERFTVYLTDFNASLQSRCDAREAVIGGERTGAGDETADLNLDHHIDEWY
jgi:hypothetical protein